jgi:hypothetical protein
LDTGDKLDKTSITECQADDNVRDGNASCVGVDEGEDKGGTGETGVRFGRSQNRFGTRRTGDLKVGQKGVKGGGETPVQAIKLT